MMPPWVTLSSYPSVVLYGDGRLIMQGPQIELYPGPALPNLQLTHLTQAGVAQILVWAEEAGLHGPDRQLGPLILDAGFTLFTVVSRDGTHRTSVTDLSASDPEIGAVSQFQDVMLNLRAWLADDIVGDDVAYVFDGLQIVSNTADPANMPDPQLSSTMDWPLDQSLATLGVPISDPSGYRCSVIEGEDLQTLMPLLAQSNELTLWQSEDEKYQLDLRPLLPDEQGCPGF